MPSGVWGKSRFRPDIQTEGHSEGQTEELIQLGEYNNGGVLPTVSAYQLLIPAPAIELRG